MVSGEGRAEVSKGVSLRDNIASSSILAHELKSPLALIRQLTFELESSELSLGERDELARQIRLTSERALRFASDIANTGRRQQELFNTAPLSSSVVCLQVVQEIQPLYKAHGRSFDFNKKSRDYLAVANPDLLHRILMNFADNALEYSDPSSVVEVYTTLLRKRDRVRFGVRDRTSLHGRKNAGAKPSQLPYDRHGLGLMIAQEFAGAFGGKIGTTRHRDGNSFYVDLMISKQLKLV
ncbi:MAG TPA: HAMP domain-containing sensor histidine kinase [Candidatus Saccharimonadales bacterium]